MAGISVGPSRMTAAMGGLNKLGQNYGGNMAGAAQQSGRLLGSSFRPNHIARPPAIGGGGNLPGMQRPMPGIPGGQMPGMQMPMPQVPITTAPSPQALPPPMQGPPMMGPSDMMGPMGGGMSPMGPMQSTDIGGMFGRYGQMGQNPNRRY